MTAATGKDLAGLTTEQLLTAVLAVLLDDREQRVKDNPSARKAELLLSDAGLPVPVVASLLGKQPDAVRMAVARARRAPAAKRKTKEDCA